VGLLQVAAGRRIAGGELLYDQTPFELLADDAHVGQEELRNYLRGEIAPREAMSVELDD
jgi:hypothetical protein